MGITDYIVRKHEKEVDSQVAVIDDLFGRPFGIGLEQMKRHGNHGCDTAKAIKNFVTWS